MAGDANLPERADDKELPLYRHGKFPLHALFRSAAKRTPSDRTALVTVSLMTVLCCAVFLATIPVPRVDGQLIGSDGVFYYAYLPTFWQDFDVDFSNQWKALGNPRGLGTFGELRGQRGNVYTLGAALLWSPFFLLAHALAWILGVLGVGTGVPGYSYFYQAVVLLGNILYGGAAIWLGYAFARRFEPVESVLPAVILIVLAGNLIYYLTAEASMSHPCSAFAVSLLCYAWVRLRNRITARVFLIYGLLGGLATLVRLQDGLYLALPLVDAMLRSGAKGGDRTRAVLKAGVLSLFAAVVLLLVVLPQFWIWNSTLQTGLTVPYLLVVHFDPLSPRLWDVLFSAWRGLFTWHPVFLLCMLGLVASLRRHCGMASLGLLGFALQWWLTASYSFWFQGDAFGGRFFISYTPWFILGLAGLITLLRRRLSWRPLLTAGAVLTGWNFLLLVYYRFHLFRVRPSWYDLTIGLGRYFTGMFF